MTTAIQVNDLHYTYEGQDGGETHIVFDGLNLSIEQGSFVAVLGHNGCGKSTLAKHFNAILLPAGGSVMVYGMDTKDEALLLAVRQHVGMVFQNPDNQIVSNVVEEDVAFAPENLGVASQEIRQRVDDALKAVGMYDYRTYAPQLLSGGKRNRKLRDIIRLHCAVIPRVFIRIAGHRAGGRHRGAGVPALLSKDHPVLPDPVPAEIPSDAGGGAAAAPSGAERLRAVPGLRVRQPQQFRQAVPALLPLYAPGIPGRGGAVRGGRPGGTFFKISEKCWYSPM